MGRYSLSSCTLSLNSCRVVVELEGYRGRWQVPSRALSWYSQGSIGATPFIQPTRTFHIIRAHAQLLSLDIEGRSECNIIDVRVLAE
mgnify:CR=1 FL=1